MNTLKYIIFIFILLANSVYGVQLVPMAKKDIKYKGKIFFHDLFFVEESKKYSCKKYLDPSLLRQNLYISKRYLIKNTPICAKDAIYAKKNIVRFQFGNLIIEREGKVIRETDEYIKIKNTDGTITKIYKDGLTR